MVTTNCLELTGQGNCTTPLSGNTAQELQQNVFKHAQQDHAEIVKKMTPQDQTKMVKRIQEVYNQKAGAGARN
jgi:predicted small metal-binding protein